MVEVLFGEAEVGSMKVAKRGRRIFKQADEPMSAIGNKVVVGKQSAKGLKGNLKEVICLGFQLDIGNIKETVDSRYRKELIYSMHAPEQWGKNPKKDDKSSALGNFYISELFRLKEYLRQGEPIRIWYSDSPYSRCGLYFLCGLLQEFHNDVLVVKMPEYMVRKDSSIVLYQNFGEVSAEEFAVFLQYEKKLSFEEQRMYAFLWNELIEDNSPLRAIINGKVIGVPEDFYDFLIWKRLSGKPITQGRLIGDVFGCNQIGISDWWYAFRINHFIEMGKVLVIEDSGNKYERTICLA